ALLDRTDVLPLALQSLDLRGGRVPVGRILQRLGAGDEPLFLAEVFTPHLLAFGEIGMTAREEAIARGAEAFPHRLLLPASDRTDGLPFSLQLLDLVGGANPVGRLGERLGSIAQRDFLREVLVADDRLLGEMCLALRPRLVVRRLEPLPQRFAL